MKRLLALALSLVMILGVLLMAGCNGDGNDGTSSSSSSSSSNSENAGNNGTTSSSASSSESDNGGNNGDFDITKKMPGYEDIDFGGRVFVMIGADGESDGFNTAKEIYLDPENESPDAIDLAVDQRNKTIEKLYNCTIQGEVSASPATEATNNVLMGGKQIDIYNQKYASVSFGTSGKVYNLLDLGSKPIDFTEVYFDQAYIQQLKVKDNNGKEKLYGIVGDFARSTFDCTHAIVFNKTVYSTTEEIRDIDIYQLVRDKKWTIDTFMTMVKAAAVDNAVPGTYKEEDGDIVGWIRTGHATHGLHVASGLTIVSNVNGSYEFNVATNASAWSAVLDKACAAWAMPESETRSYSYIPDAVAGNRALFASEILSSSLGNLKDLDVEIGLLPYPTYTEGANYYHYVDEHFSPYAVPLHVADIENVGDFLVLFAYYSKHIVRPAYINLYAYEYCSDEDSYEMLDIILSSRTYDVGYLGAKYEGNISDMINTNKANQITSFANSKAKVFGTWVSDYIGKVTANKS